MNDARYARETLPDDFDVRSQPEPLDALAGERIQLRLDHAPLTYEAFYELAPNPFALAADPNAFHPSRRQDRAAREMLAAINHAGGSGGVVVLTGEAGAGKTTLCRSLIRQLDRRAVPSFIVDSPRSIEDLLKAVLVDFGLISSADLSGDHLARATRQDLVLAVETFLATLDRLGAFAVVFLDEAHDCAPSLFEQLQALLGSDRVNRVMRIVLVGQPSLLTLLEKGELRPFAERVTARCEIGSLEEDEIPGYIRHRLALAGARDTGVWFDDDACRLIYEWTQGFPRRVNRLCDRVLTAGYAESAGVVGEDLVRRGAGDLEPRKPGSARTRAFRVVAVVVAIALLALAGLRAAAWLFPGN